MILESNVIGKGTAAVVPPFEKAVSENQATFGSDEVAVRGSLVNGFRTGIKCANLKLGGCGFIFYPVGNEPPGQKLDSISILAGDDRQLGLGEA
jgi:hypothetical protein